MKKTIFFVLFFFFYCEVKKGYKDISDFEKIEDIKMEELFYPSDEITFEEKLKIPDEYFEEFKKYEEEFFAEDFYEKEDIGIVSYLCSPCNEDSDCGGDSPLCISYGESGSFCSYSCKELSECPENYICKENLCVFKNGDCPCPTIAISSGAITECKKIHKEGVCKGFRICTKNGLTQCIWTGEGDVDDKNPCTIGEHCGANGEIVPGILKDCTLLDDQCNLGICDFESGNCVKKPFAENTPCNADNNGCTLGDYCKDGICIAGKEIDCNEFNKDCVKGVCISNNFNSYFCKEEPLSEKTPCNDGNACTIMDKCDGKGKCIEGKLLDCAESKDACAIGVCNPQTGCEKISFPDGTTCIPDDPCYVEGKCNKSKCEGKFLCDDGKDCTEDSCLAGLCKNKVKDSFCLIDGKCYEKDMVSQNPCLSCQPEKNTDGWTFSSPCLYYGKKEIGDLKKLADGNVKSIIGTDWKNFYDNIKGKADSIVQNPQYTYEYKNFKYTFSEKMPSPHPDAFPYWTAMFQEQRSDNITVRINVLTFVYLLTGDKKYLDLAIEMVKNLCSWEKWSDPDYSCLPGPSCLDTAHAAMSVSYFLDSLREVLSFEDKKFVCDCLIGKLNNEGKKIGGEPLETAVSWALEKDYVYQWLNGFALVASALAVTGASLYIEKNSPKPAMSNEDIEKAKKWMELGIKGAKEFIDANSSDGGAYEGQVYGAYAMDYIIRTLIIAERFWDSILNEFVKNIPEFIWSELSTDFKSLAPVGDSSEGLYWIETASYLVKSGLPLAGGYLQNTGLSLSPSHISSILLLNPPISEIPEKRGFIFEEVGHGSIRTGWNKDDTLLVFKSGPPFIEVGHNHLDSGTFLLNFNGSWILSDPGYRNTSTTALSIFTTQTYGHSGVLIDGSGQKKKKGGVITGIAGADKTFAMCGEYSDTYNNPYIKEAKRCLLTMRDKSAAVFDFFEFLKPTDVQILFQPHSTGFSEIKNDIAKVFGSQAFVFLFSGAGSLKNIPPYNGIYEFPSHPEVQFMENGEAIPQLNKGFENGDFTGWTPRSLTIDYHKIVSENCYEGNYCAKIFFNENNSGYYYGDFFPVKKDDKLRLRVWIRTENVEGVGAYPRILFWKNKKYISDCKKDPVVGSSLWNEKSLYCYVPAGVDEVSASLEFSSAKGSAWFDNIEFDVINGEGKIIKNLTGIIPEKLPWGILNGGFEYGMWQWTPRFYDGSHKIIENDCKEGKKCGNITLPAPNPPPGYSPNAGYFYSNFFEVIPKKNISASAFVKMKGEGLNAGIRLLFYKGGKYSNKYISSGNINKADDFIELSLSGKVPDDVDSVRLALEFNTTKGGWASFDVADVIMEGFENEKMKWEPPIIVEKDERFIIFDRNWERTIVASGISKSPFDDLLIETSFFTINLNFDFAYLTFKDEKIIRGGVIKTSPSGEISHLIILEKIEIEILNTSEGIAIEWEIKEGTIFIYTCEGLKKFNMKIKSPQIKKALINGNEHQIKNVNDWVIIKL